MPQPCLLLRPTLLAGAGRGLCAVLCGLSMAAQAQPAAFTVTSSADSGPGTLRQALADAPSGATITFATPMTITLASPLVIQRGLVVRGELDGDGAPDVTISGNDAVQILRVETTEPVALDGLVLTRGFSTIGGAGVYMTFGQLTISRSELSHNRDVGIGGGALLAFGAAITLLDSRVAHNSSESFGGGLRVVSAGGQLTVAGSTITANRTTGPGGHGGGIQFGGTLPLSITNSTISGNAAQGVGSLGGGLRITSGTASVTHTTIVGNAALGDGGGVSGEGTETFTNVVVAGNTVGAGAVAAPAGGPLASGGTDDDVSSTVEVAARSYFGTATTIATNQGSLVNQGTAGLLLGPLAPNHGPTPTHLPLAGSALIDAAPCLAGIGTDQRGVARPRGAQCDIGAVEAGLTTPAAPTQVSARAGDGSVTVSWEAVTDTGGLPITGYVVTATPGGATCTAGPSATECTVAGLVNGQTYTFTVQAVTGAGASPAAATSAVAPLPRQVAIPTLSQWGVLLLSALLGVLALRMRPRGA